MVVRLPSLLENHSSNVREKDQISKISTKQAGAELCQAQVKLGIAKVEIFFHLIENKAVLDLK